MGLVLPCYNQEGNVDELYERLVKVFHGLPDYTFEMLFIDNASTDGIVAKVKALVDRDARVKLRSSTPAISAISAHRFRA
jgi:polyisoprenyl-phosphate glycosyltransferase